MSQATIADYYEKIDAVDNLRRYRGIPMICLDGLHERVAEVAEQHLAPGARILDVGCGRGAFALRMHDRGFEVDACDMYDHCMCKDAVNFHCGTAETIDFSGAYDGVFLLELIEHTESPFGVLRRYAERVKPGGYLFVSTPNIDSDFSRAWFFLSGRHWYFEDSNLRNDGHIMPVHRFQLDYLQQELGWESVADIPFADRRRARPGAHWLAIQLLRWYRWLKRRPACEGEVTFQVFRKPEPTTP